MRENKIINDNWKFVSKDIDVSEIKTTLGELVNLPHTWNNIDGQDGGNDYYRGRCWYVKEFSKPTLNDEELWLEFKGVAMVADVYVNGKHLEQHKGGYSTFRVNVTEVLEEENVIAVAVDNSYTREVYPQKADFTFYGGKSSSASSSSSASISSSMSGGGANSSSVSSVNSSSSSSSNTIVFIVVVLVVVLVIVVVVVFFSCFNNLHCPGAHTVPSSWQDIR